jgi:dephospho-CoA kinase
MDVWGLTGLMGSGKSFARELLAKKGIPCLDADVETSKLLTRLNEVTHLSLQERETFLEELQMAFPGTRDPAGTGIDKQKLLPLVSRSTENRKLLESIVIPRIGLLLRAQIQKLKIEKHRVCFVEGTRLAESSLRKDILKGIIFVEAQDSVRFERIKKRNPQQFEALMELQKSQDPMFMKKVSNEIWVNNDSPEEFQKQVDSFLLSHGYHTPQDVDL